MKLNNCRCIEYTLSSYVYSIWQHLLAKLVSLLKYHTDDVSVMLLILLLLISFIYDINENNLCSNIKYCIILLIIIFFIFKCIIWI